MPFEALKKIWVSCHLLYPNPSQARDIFGHVVEVESISQVENDRSLQLKLLQRFYKVFKKRAAVKSGSAFFEFSTTTLNHWKKIQLKCTQDETFILLMVLLQQASFEEISKITRLHESKVKYLFNQSLKKVITSAVFRFEQKKEIKLKEYQSNEVSLLYVNEHLTEHVLGLTNDLTKEKLDTALKDNNRFNDYKNEILKFRDEINNLPVSHHYDEAVKLLSDTTQLNQLKKIEIRQHKKLVALFSLLAIVIIGLIVRPSFLKTSSLDDNKHKLILEEVAINKKEIEPPPLTMEKYIETPQPVVVSAPTVVVVTPPPVVLPATKTKAKLTPHEVKAKAEVTVYKAIEKAEKSQQSPGVYRGIITVTDFEQVSSMIRDKIVEVGGQKAGEVELGWIKNHKTSYFHFTFPTDKKDEIVTFIQQYGDFQFKLEPHPRLLPAGQGRFILEVHKGE